MTKIAGVLTTLGFTFAAVTLTACGGGGGSSSGGSMPHLPGVANTALSYYMPMAQGNSWTFASGGKMEDLGHMSVTCVCAANGMQMERIGVYSPGSSTAGASFFLTTTPASGQNGRLTNLIGVENDANTNNITIVSNVPFPDGVPVMDDQPTVNESWGDGVGDQSAITSVGGTLMLSNNEQVINVAIDQLTGSFSTITWGFAKGVGFTQIGVSGQSTSITSFYVNTSSSQSVARKSDAVMGRVTAVSTGRLNAAPILSRLFR